jgi:sugar (pentulose or hexulose) kinase
MGLLLAIDAGTTSVKAGLFSPEGECLAISRHEYQLSTPRASWAELDPETYWQGCKVTVRGVLDKAGRRGTDVSAVSVSSQGETLIALDRKGKPVSPAIVWLDNRATAEAESLAAKFSQDAYRTTGIPEIIPTWTACKILWLRRNQPEVFKKAAMFLLVQDYLVYRLTGRFATNASIACTSLCFDIVAGSWWKDVLQEIGVAEASLPEVLASGGVAGQVSAEAAADTGLGSTAKVIGGGMDQSVGAIGAGNIMPGIVSETTGAALTIQATIPSPHIDKEQVVPVYAHSLPGSFLFVPVCPTAGMAYRWFRDTFGQVENARAERESLDAFDLLNALAAGAPPGCDGLVMLPHLMGAFSPKANPYARGSFTGFTLRHNRSHFARAVLEGVAFLLKANLDAMQRAGISVQEIRSTGGGARSPLWNQIKANVAGVPVVTLENEETALLGNAILAGAATGVFSSAAEGCGRMVTIKNRIPPNEEAAAYVQPYRMYTELDGALRSYYIGQYREAKAN